MVLFQEQKIENIYNDKLEKYVETEETLNGCYLFYWNRNLCNDIVHGNHEWNDSPDA
jgi:hypothetical protein